MNPALLVLLAAQAAAMTPTPTPTASLTILLARPNSQSAMPSGSLSDIAKTIKLKLPEGHPRVLTNESVKRLAEGVELTTTIGGGPLPPPVAVTQESEKKAMWQQRYRDAVERVAHLEEDVKRLDSEASRLEQEFYAHDDPAQRDAVIKPAWDKALADLQQARADLAEARGGPDKVLNAARRDGALPGWFRGLDQGGAPVSQQAAPLPTPATERPQPTPTQPPRAKPAGPS
jgi:hypothetical protein